MPSPHQVEEASAMYEDSMEVRHHGTSKPILPTPATTTSTPHNSPSLRHESVSYSSSEVSSDEYSEYQSSSEFDDSKSLSFESGESSASDLLMRKPAITFLDEADERSAVPGYTYPVPSKPLNINSYKVYSPDNPFKPGGSNRANRLPSVKTNVQLTPTDSYGVPKGSPIGVYSSENPFKPGGSDSQPSTSYSPENPFQPSNQYSTPGSDEVRGYSGSVDSAYQTPSTPSKGNQVPYKMFTVNGKGAIKDQGTVYMPKTTASTPTVSDASYEAPSTTTYSTTQPPTIVLVPDGYKPKDNAVKSYSSSDSFRDSYLPPSSAETTTSYQSTTFSSLMFDNKYSAPTTSYQTPESSTTTYTTTTTPYQPPKTTTKYRPPKQTTKKYRKKKPKTTTYRPPTTTTTTTTYRPPTTTTTTTTYRPPTTKRPRKKKKKPKRKKKKPYQDTYRSGH